MSFAKEDNLLTNSFFRGNGLCVVTVNEQIIENLILFITNFLFTAPEIQMNSHCTILSDMFSLGMVICTTFNNGRPLIQSNNSTSAYLKQLELLDDAVRNILPRIPIPLQEATSRLVSKAAGPRPTAQLLQLIKYFR